MADPTTPRKRKAPTVKAEPGEDVDMSGTSPTKKAKAAPKNANDKRPIPKSVEELTPEDAMLLKMKKEGKSMADIQKAWKDATGLDRGGSVLTTRIKRIMANITDVEPEDREKFYEGKQAVEEAIEKEIKEIQNKKWSRVAQSMEDNGSTTKYDAATLEKFYKKHRDAASTAATEPAAEEMDGVDEE